jgi:hypothetical protein
MRLAMMKIQQICQKHHFYSEGIGLFGVKQVLFLKM